MTTEETRKFLKTEGVATTLASIFNQVKVAIENGEKLVSIYFTNEEDTKKFKHVIDICGYETVIATKSQEDWFIFIKT